MTHRQRPVSSILSLAALFVSVITFLGCERDMSIKADEKNPPSFLLSGSGNLMSFAVMEVPPENQTQTIQRSSDSNILLWEIEPTNADNKIRRLPVITYGKVPPGFAQKFPADGSRPPPLVEGKIYEAGGPAYGANGGLIWFQVRGDKTVHIPIPGSTPESVRGKTSEPK